LRSRQFRIFRRVSGGGLLARCFVLLSSASFARFLPELFAFAASLYTVKIYRKSFSENGRQRGSGSAKSNAPKNIFLKYFSGWKPIQNNRLRLSLAPFDPHFRKIFVEKGPPFRIAWNSVKQRGRIRCKEERGEMGKTENAIPFPFSRYALSPSLTPSG
jgi:hypothetical protein